jgi:hypothetical protein
MPQLGFEPTIPVFEVAQSVHALDRAGTVIVDIIIDCRNQENILLCRESIQGIYRDKNLVNPMIQIR